MIKCATERPKASAKGPTCTLTTMEALNTCINNTCIYIRLSLPLHSPPVTCFLYPFSSVPILFSSLAPLPFHRCIHPSYIYLWCRLLIVLSMRKCGLQYITIYTLQTPCIGRRITEALVYK